MAEIKLFPYIVKQLIEGESRRSHTDTGSPVGLMDMYGHSSLPHAVVRAEGHRLTNSNRTYTDFSTSTGFQCTTGSGCSLGQMKGIVPTQAVLCPSDGSTLGVSYQGYFRTNKNTATEFKPFMSFRLYEYNLQYKEIDSGSSSTSFAPAIRAIITNEESEAQTFDRLVVFCYGSIQLPSSSSSTSWNSLAAAGLPYAFIDIDPITLQPNQSVTITLDYRTANITIS